ncbi:hypothetical protein LCI18_008827 [Fusarium solani-melongenae]|uniref:Uncharacterized protein n=1 Tax=Fusarium solani subsp. cucurbitae TaxID=2747967 RepID=A0ACD3Z9K9_FUSSC|nr:hypothetical protein LCI18_008827 [Fusarium solani-melongenae]
MSPEAQARIRSYDAVHPSAGRQVTNRETGQSSGHAMNFNHYNAHHTPYAYPPAQPQLHGVIPSGNGQVPGVAYSHHHPNMAQHAQMQRGAMESFLKELDFKHEQQRSSIISVLEQSYACISQAAATIKNGVSRLLGGQQDANKTGELQERLRVTTQEKLNFEAQAKHLSAKNDTLHQMLQEAQDKLARALQERDEQRRLADGETLANSTKLTDDAVRGKWKELDYNISTLAKALAKYSPGRTTDDTVKHRFNAVSPSWRALIAKEDFREFILCAYLWMLVEGEVFDGKGGVWAGETAAAFKSLRGKLIARLPRKVDPTKRATHSLQQGARWLVQGSAILDSTWGYDRKALQHLTTTEVEALDSFLRFSKCDTGMIASRVAEEMKVILKSAVELDRMLMSSRALFLVRWPDMRQDTSELLVFDNTLMEAVAWEREVSPKSVVELIVSPSLVKLGNADGQNYDKHIALSKGSVVCN